MVNRADQSPTVTDVTAHAGVPEKAAAGNGTGSILTTISNHPIISGAFATVIGTLALALLTNVGSGIRPQPPAKIAAEVSDVRVTNYRISLQDFVIDYFDLPPKSIQDGDQLRALLKERGLPAEVTDDALGTMGLVVTYDVTLHGLANRHCIVEWTVHEAATRAPVKDAYLRDRTAFPHGILVATAQEERLSDHVWIPRPPRAGEFFVTLEFLDDSPIDRRIPLAHAESPTFD